MINNPPIIISQGQFTGDSTPNRAIPHGLGRIPRAVFLNLDTAGSFFNILSTAVGVQFVTGAMHAVTAMDATNFYVGNAANYGESANFLTAVYNWVAI